MTGLLIAAIVLTAAFLQSLSGFGFAIVVMPVLTLILGLQTAAPLVSLTALTVYTINVTRFRRAIHAGEVLRLGLASALGVPVGIWVLAAAPVCPVFSRTARDVVDPFTQVGLPCRVPRRLPGRGL
jgi:uncharacterized membrane protein YfcA